MGTSAASISPNSSTSACLIELGETRIMVDAGIGAARQLRKAGVSPDMINAVLLTHWHFDHCAGLPGLVRSRKHSSPLCIYGPSPPFSTRIFLRAIFPAVFGCFTPVEGRRFKDFADIRAEAFGTIHKIASVGWVFTEIPPGHRRIVISGDTRPAGALIKAAHKADLLIHEATYLEKHSRRALAHWHSTAAEAAKFAAASEVGGLALTHLASRYSTDAIRMEAEKIFPGTLIPEPMMILSIGPVIDESKEQGCGWANIRVVDKNIK